VIQRAALRGILLFYQAKQLRPFGAKQSTRCGGPTWRKTCKQNSFCVGVIW